MVNKPAGLKAYWVIACCLTVLLSCAGTFRGVPIPAIPPASHLLVDSLHALKSFGDVAIRAERDFYRAHAQVFLEQTDLLIDILGPFGGSVAALWADSDSVHLSVQGRRFDVGRLDGLQSLPYFRQYPFNFCQFARIITGRPLFLRMLRSSADSSWVKRRTMFFGWENDALSVLMSIGVRRRLPDKVVYQSKEEPHWVLSFEKFVEPGLARSVRFEIDQNNYFSYDAQHITVNAHDRLNQVSGE